MQHLPAAAPCQACAPFCLLPLQPGIQFQDVTTILLDPTAFKHTIDMLVERYQGQQVDVVAGAQPPRVGWQGMSGLLAGCRDSRNGGATAPSCVSIHLLLPGTATASDPLLPGTATASDPPLPGTDTDFLQALKRGASFLAHRWPWRWAAHLCRCASPANSLVRGLKGCGL